MSRVEDQSQQIKRLISKDKEQSEKMERSISTVQGHPLQRERRGPINQIFASPFEWRVKMYNIPSQGLVSPPFYLFERGYKYSLQIVTIDAGSSVCVYIKVVPGEFDELLSWPCKEKVRVAWDNQYGLFLGGCKSNVVDFEKGMVLCRRPLNDDHYAYYQALLFYVGVNMVLDTILITVNRE